MTRVKIKPCNLFFGVMTINPTQDILMSVKSVKHNVLVPHYSPDRYQAVILICNFFVIF